MNVKGLIQNARGVTLIELLAAVVIFSIALTVIYSAITNFLSYQNKIQAEIYLRDEADIIMTRFMNEIFPAEDATTLEDNIIQLTIPDEDGSGTSKQVTLGFKDGKALLNGDAIHDEEKYSLAHSTVAINDDIVNITMTIKDLTEEKAYSLMLESEISLLNKGAYE